jgi:hypothetical protein
MRKHAITLLKPFRRERDWSLSHRALRIALPVMQSSLRLAPERGETNTDVERVSLKYPQARRQIKRGLPTRKNQDFEATPVFSQSRINTAVGDMTAAVFVNL